MDQRTNLAGTGPVAVSARAPDAGAAEPLRSRRRRELRQHISDVATRMFFQKGFDAVRVADVAGASGVTEKTVFNHFPTKESLLADRWEARIATARRVLADPQVAPVAALVDMVEQELALLVSPPWPTVLGSHLADMQRYSCLMRDTPALRTHEREQLNQLTAAVADALAERDQRSGKTGDDAEQWMTAIAVVGLWSVFLRSLHRAVHLQQGEDLSALRRSVSGDVARAADLLGRGLRTPDAAVR